jgi:CO/xanthine dehydrogenase Mo-binding subunit
MMTIDRMNRREFFAKLGQSSLAVGFSLSPMAASIAAADKHGPLDPSDLTITSGTLAGAFSPPTDAWITIDHHGRITLFSGKVELGTGTETAFLQIVAEELYVDVSAITYVQGDTSQTPDQGFTAGSNSIFGQGPLVRTAAATAFQELLTLASAYLGVSTGELMARDGRIGIAPDMRHAVSYGRLFAGQQISLVNNASAPTKAPGAYTVVGQPVPRVDLFDKFTGKFAYVSDIVVPGMLHGRIVRVNGGTTSKAKNATLVSVDDSAALAIPGFLRTVQKGNFVGVVATTEWAAIQAAKALNVTWSNGTPLVSDFVETDMQPALVNSSNIYATSMQEKVVSASSAPATTLTRNYYSPYTMHGSIGPSCAVANVTSTPDENGILATVWSGTQGVYDLQQALANILGIPAAAIRVIYVEGPGCYGQNGSDDAAADAALMSQIVGKPVRLQWMRWYEHGWEPLGPAIAHTLNGALSAGGGVVSWSHELWSPPHSSRPGGGGALLAGQETGLIPSALPTAPVNQATRNAPVNYNFPNMLITSHQVEPYRATPTGAAVTPLVNTLPRSTALRSLGGMSNSFANESFIDDLALAANTDPIRFRETYVCALNGSSNALNNVPVPGVDARAVTALQAMATKAGWGNPLAPPTVGNAVGKGVSFVRYETALTYVAAYAEVEVTTSTGAVWVRRVVVAHDCGLIINPNGLKNQIEGNVIQGISRTLIEEVGFNTNGVTSLLWASTNPTPPPGTTYPVIHFSQVPSSIEIVLLDNPEQPAWGAGEPTIEAIAPAIGNAIFNAIGKRLTILPITSARVLAALS